MNPPPEPRPAPAGFLGQLFGMIFKGGRWWMLPVLGVLLLLAVVLIAIRSVEYVAPFVYLVF